MEECAKIRIKWPGHLPFIWDIVRQHKWGVVFLDYTCILRFQYIQNVFVHTKLVFRTMPYMLIIEPCQVLSY